MSSADPSMSGDTTAPAANPVWPPGLPPAANGGASMPPLGIGGSFGGVPQDPPTGDTPDNSGGGFIMYPGPPPAVHPYATVSIKSHILVTLTMKSNAYSRWASFFKSMCGKFSLKSHIDGTVAPCPQDPNWDQADCCVRSWLFGSIDDSVLDLAITDDDQTTWDLWLAISPRLPLHDTRRLLHHRLVLNLLHGLNLRFSDTADDIANSNAGFPSFTQAWDMLALKELRLANEENISNSTALLVRTSLLSSSSSCTGGCRLSFGSVQTGDDSGSSSSGRGGVSSGHGGGRSGRGGGGGKKKWQKKGGSGF
nr:uncharacterized protein LOC117835445 [Setaria viridis]